VLTSKALVVESEGEPAPSFLRKRALQLTNANKVPARDPDPLPSQHLRCTAGRVHTLHLQAMSIESAQVGGPCGCTHLEVVRAARPGRAQTAGSWLPAVSRLLLCNKRRVRWPPAVCMRGLPNLGPINRQLFNPCLAWAPINRQRLCCSQATLCR